MVRNLLIPSLTLLKLRGTYFVFLHNEGTYEYLRKIADGKTHARSSAFLQVLINSSHPCFKYYSKYLILCKVFVFVLAVRTGINTDCARKYVYSRHRLTKWEKREGGPEAEVLSKNDSNARARQERGAC